MQSEDNRDRFIADVKICGDACVDTEVMPEAIKTLFTPLALPGIGEVFTMRKTIFTSTASSPTFTVPMTKEWVLSILPFDLASKYACFSCNLTFELTSTATIETSGLINMCLHPISPNTVYGVTYNLPQRCMNVPHVNLNLSYAKTAQITTQWPLMLPYEFVTEAPEGPMPEPYTNTLSIVPIVPVTTATGGPGWSFQLYVTVTDLRVYAKKAKNATAITFQSGENTAIGYSGGMFSKVAKPSWWLAAMSEAAAAFGYSTPQVPTKPERVYNSNQGNEMHYDIPRVLDVIHTHSMATIPTCSATMGQAYDEMVYAHMLSKYSLLGIADGTASTATNNVQMRIPICLPYFWYRGRNGVLYMQKRFPDSHPLTAMYQPSNLLFHGAMFERWRGTIKFRLQIVRPRLSQGKIAIDYIPAAVCRTPPYIANFTIDVPNVTDTNSRIMECELGEEEFIDFSIPFTMPMASAGFMDCTGVVQLSWVSGYQGPLGTGCAILAFVAAGEDFQLMDPVVPRCVPMLINSTVELQSGDVHRVAPMGTMSALSDNGVLRSCKQLLSLPYWQDILDPAPGTEIWRMPPWMYRQPCTASAGVSAYSDSYQNCLASCFLFGKGGTEIHVYHGRYDTSVTAAHSSATGYTQASPTFRTSAYTDASVIGPVVPKEAHQAKHFLFPCIMRHPIMPLLNYLPSTVYPRDVPFSGANSFEWGVVETANPSSAVYPLRIPALKISSATAAAITIGTAAADDAALSYYLGPPPCIVHDDAILTQFHPTNTFNF